MALTLSIENFTQLPDGGPLSISVSGKRGIDIGRDTHLDWTLPDPTRYISGKHCEVRFRDGGYWLHDVSTNGTMLYGAEGRLKGPHLLRHGDRLVIGQYIIVVALDGEGAAPPAPARDVQPSSYAELWTPTEDAAPPVARSAIQSAREAPAALRPDFLDWAADVPDTLEGATPRVASRFDIDLPPATSPFDAGPGRGPSPAPSRPAPLPSDDDLGWAHGAPKPLPQVEPPPAVPNPRRPVWVSNEPDGPWGAPAAAETRAEKPAAPAILDEVSRSPTSPAMPSADRAWPAASDAPGPSEPSVALPTAAIPPAAGAAAAGPGVPAEFLRRVALGAGVPEQTFAQQNPDQVAEQLGALMRLMVENVRQLLTARLEAKRLARTSNQTMIQALDNNPLKFSPSAEEALRIMFGPPTKSYLDARRAFEQSFEDLKAHQIQTYSAMQHALRMLVDDLDPQAIDNDTEADRGIAAVVGSRKARLWDAYVARWQAKTRRQEGGMVDVYMQYFAECYDRGANKIR